VNRNVFSIIVVLFLAGFSAAQIKIACIGCSITAGVGTNANHSYPSLLQQRLGTGYTILNAGASGTVILKNQANSYWKSGQLAGVFAFKPNIITFIMGGNDAYPPIWNTSGQYYKRDYSAFIDTLNTLPTHPQIWILLEVPYFGQYGNDTCLEKILAIERQVATERGLPLVDTHTPLLPFRQYFPDGIHPNDAGHDTMARVIYRAFTTTNPADKFIVRRHPYKIAASSDFLPYRLFYPLGYNRQTRYPLILTLHGVGESGADNNLQVQSHRIAGIWAEDSTQAKQKCFVVSPQCPPTDTWVKIPAWRDMFYSTSTLPMSNSLQGALSLVDSLVREFPIDTNRLYVTGLSMGGYGTWDLVTRYPKKFAAAVPLSGGCDTSKAEAIKNVPIWTFHGALDPTVPPAATRAMIASLKNKGIPVVQYSARYADYFGNATVSRTDLTNKIDSLSKVLYAEYTDGVHDIWTKSYNDPLLARWLFLQKKSAPTPVSFRTGKAANADARRGRAVLCGAFDAAAIGGGLVPGRRYAIKVFDMKGALRCRAIVDGPDGAKTFQRNYLSTLGGIKIITLNAMPFRHRPP
jgi:poly(3-hydroxybutyrate) depolymerase/lysophospholipase L1-like esterase